MFAQSKLYEVTGQHLIHNPIFCNSRKSGVVCFSSAFVSD
jgi:hypothetical protein